MLKLLTCKKVPVAVKAFKEGSTTTMIKAAVSRPHFCDFDRRGCIASVQTPAAAGKKPARFPLQEENNGHQYHYFSGDGRAGRLLQHLIRRTDAEGRAN